MEFYLTELRQQTRETSRMNPTLMVSTLIAAGLAALSPLLHAQDRRPGAAALAECCTPGDKDFPPITATLATSAIPR
jgi:hypothetical protein